MTPPDPSRPKKRSLQKRTALEPCDLCQVVRPVVRLYRVDGWNIVRCTVCGLVFLSRAEADQLDLPGLYPRDYYEGSLADGYANLGDNEPQMRSQARASLGRLRRHQPGGRLLEIGCSYGYFLLEARPWFAVEGIEISAHAAAQAVQRGLPVRSGDFLELPVPEAAYDAVCLFDCIEHLGDPYASLAKVRQILKPGGVVAITTGDIGSLYARLSGPRWRLMTPPRHTFYFTRRTLTGMLQAAGLRVLEISYPWKLVSLPQVLHRLSPRLRSALGPLGRLPLGLTLNLFDAMLVIARKE